MEPKITDWIMAVSAAITALGILILLIQTALLHRQISDARRWNKLHSAMTFLPTTDLLNNLEAQLNKDPVRLIDRREPLSQEELQTLLSGEHNVTRINLKNYLNLLERYCVGIEFGLADDVIAKALVRSKFIRHFTELKPYIQYLRGTHNSPSYLCSFENVVKNWEEKTESQQRY